MRYGRRIRNGNNGDIQWCELSTEEVLKALTENVRLNAEIFRLCFGEALNLANVKSHGGEAAVALNPSLKQAVDEVACRLFEQCGVKAFVALQEALDEKVHYHKIHNLV